MGKSGYSIDLGVMEYEEAWRLQHQLWLMRVEDNVPDLLLLIEHPHVITLGRRGNRSNLLASPEMLKAMKIPLFHVERGGDVTYHGPGQMVIYPILGLEDYGYRLADYIKQLEEVMISVLKDYGIEGCRDTSNRGVWVNGEKIASIGVTIRQRVSFHGVALNYNTDLKYFELIHPCGLRGKRVTSMAKLLERESPREGLIESIRYHFARVFERDWEEKGLSDILTGTCPASYALPACR